MGVDGFARSSPMLVTAAPVRSSKAVPTISSLHTFLLTGHSRASSLDVTSAATMRPVIIHKALKLSRHVLPQAGCRTADVCRKNEGDSADPACTIPGAAGPEAARGELMKSHSTKPTRPQVNPPKWDRSRTKLPEATSGIPTTSQEHSSTHML